MARCAVLLLIIVSALKVLDFTKADYTRILQRLHVLVTFAAHNLGQLI